MRWTFEELKELGLGFISGSTNQKFKTILNESNIKEIEKQPLNEELTNSFKDGKYKTYITIDEIVLYKLMA